MSYRINGAGPVGLMTACLLSLLQPPVKIEIYDKRETYQRDHSLFVDRKTVDQITKYLNELEPSAENSRLCDIIQKFRHQSVRTNEIEAELLNFLPRHVLIHRGASAILQAHDVNVCLIGADGSRSQIRKQYFNGELSDVRTIGYLAQVKFQTSKQTRPRSSISAVAYSMLNSISGWDMAVDFESLSRKSSDIKYGTLHIPIDARLYQYLTEKNRGTYENPWRLKELSRNQLQPVQKLCDIIKRYRVSLNFRNGWLSHEKITALPLQVYRSSQVARRVNQNHVFLVGDASSGLVYERGLNKGWLETVALVRCLGVKQIDFESYNTYCQTLYHKEVSKILKTGGKIKIANQGLTIIALFLIIGLCLWFGFYVSKLYGCSLFIVDK